MASRIYFGKNIRLKSIQKNIYARIFCYIRAYFYLSTFCDGINLVKSSKDAPVEDKILEILFVDGHLGCPSFDQRLLLLNVVGSRPLHFASPEQDIWCSVANFSIALHTSSCVMTILLFFSGFPIQQSNNN